MGSLVMQLALPALIIQSFTRRPAREIVDLHYLLVYGISAPALLLGAFTGYRVALRVPISESAVRALTLWRSRRGRSRRSRAS